LRQQLLEAWEAQEWADREASLEATQVLLHRHPEMSAVLQQQLGCCLRHQ